MFKIRSKFNALLGWVVNLLRAFADYLEGWQTQSGFKEQEDYVTDPYVSRLLNTRSKTTLGAKEVDEHAVEFQNRHS